MFPNSPTTQSQIEQPVYVSNYQMPGLNLYINPLFNGYMDQIMAMDGQMIRAVNFESFPTGAMRKRAGYTSFLNSLGTQTNQLFSWNQNQASQIYLYNYTAGTLFYYDVTAGTGTAWIPTGNGTFGAGNVGGGGTPGQFMGNAVIVNTMIVGDGVGSTRHSTDGINFTNTTGAPVGSAIANYQNAAFIAGTGNSSLAFSTAGDPTNWTIGGTSTSGNFTIPGPGFVKSLFILAQNLFIGKTTGHVFRYDGYNIWDQSAENGPTSPWSVVSKDGNGFWLATDGIYTSQGDTPSLISNAIQPQIYNRNINGSNTGIAPLNFGSAPATLFRYDYLLAVGSIQDDFTNEPMNNAIIKYNILQNSWMNYVFNDPPTAFHTFKDFNSNYQMYFGGTAGQIFKFDNTKTSDNGASIPAYIDMVFNFNMPYLLKDWRWFWGFFEPGCEAQISIAATDTFDRTKKNWIDIGDATAGLVAYRFPQGMRSRLLWVRIREESQVSRMTFYGCTIQAIPKDPG